MSLRWLTRILLLLLLASTQCHALLRDATPKDSYESLQQNGPTSRGAAGCSIQMRTDTAGIDFNDYLRVAYLSVKKRWLANLPGSAEKGQQGFNAIEFHVLQDGSVPKDSVKMVTSSEKSDFDSASLQAIQEATPFNHLPEQFAKPFIVLRFTFYYNQPIPRTPR
jgi:TonB family protein